MKKALKFLIPILLLALLALPVSAQSASVFDEAGLFEEPEVIRQKAAGLAQDFSIDVVVLTVDDIDGADVKLYAADYYDENGFGVGADRDGLIFCICTEPNNRNFAFVTTGKEEYIFTDSSIDRILAKIKPYLSAGDYDGGADVFLEEMRQANLDPPSGRTSADEPIREKGEFPIVTVLVGVAIGLVIGLIVVLAEKKKLNPVAQAAGAMTYLVSDSFHLRDKSELFAGTTVSRTARPKSDSSGSSGGGGHFTSSSGSSHGGGSSSF